MNQTIELITYLLTKLTDLKKDQIIIAQPGTDNYSHLFCIKDNRIIDLGELSYDQYIATRLTELNRRLVTRFTELAAINYKDRTELRPVLYGNINFSDLHNEFKQIVKDYRNDK